MATEPHAPHLANDPLLGLITGMEEEQTGCGMEQSIRRSLGNVAFHFKLCQVQKPEETALKATRELRGTTSREVGGLGGWRLETGSGKSQCQELSKEHQVAQRTGEFQAILDKERYSSFPCPNVSSHCQFHCQSLSCLKQSQDGQRSSKPQSKMSQLREQKCKEQLENSPRGRTLALHSFWSASFFRASWQYSR